MPPPVMTYYASRSRSGLALFATLAFILIGWLLVYTASAVGKGENTSLAFWVGWFLLLFGTVLFPIAISNIIYRFPRLILHPNGLEYLEPFVLFRKKIEHQWKDVGPFAVGQFQMSAASTMYVACAFTDESHDLLVSRNDNASPNFFHADIKVPLQPFSFGQTLEDAKAFTDELNTWREKFGRPDIAMPNRNTDDLYLQLKTKNKRAVRNTLLWALLAPIFFWLAISSYSLRSLLF